MAADQPIDEVCALVAEARELLHRLRWLLEGKQDPFDAALERLRARIPARPA